MFCKSCGTQIPDGNKFCTKCGTPVEGVAQPTAPVALNANGIGAMIKPYIPFIAVGVAALSLIVGIINLFFLYDVSLSWGGYTAGSGPVSDLAFEEGCIMLSIGNVIFGIVLILVAGIGTLNFLKKFGINYYDSFVAKFIGADPLFIMGVSGAGAALINVIFYAMSGEMGVSISAHWTAWVVMILFLIVGLADKFVVNKK